MSTRLWYLRRGVAWLPLLGACVAAAVTAVLLARWPDDAFLLAPALLACCAAAAAFVYDEDALPVVAVTPRGAGWRRANRLGVTLVPLSVWALVVALRPGDVPFWRPGWWLLGGATVLLVAGSAALASRRLVPTPGALLAPVVAVAAVAPVTLAGMFSWGTLYPIGDFPDPVRTVWLGVTLSGAAICAVALRPGLRHRRAGLDARRRAEGQGKDAGLARRAAAIEAAPPASEGTHVSTATSPVHLTAATVWLLRLAGLAALVNGAGFGAFDIPGTWHLAHDHEIWHADGNPTYGNGPFEAHGISVTVPVLLAFFGTCLVLAIGGALLLAPRTNGVVVTLAGMVMCAPFWWGFDLPFAWFSAASILALLAMAWAAWMFTRPGPASRRWPDTGDRAISHPSAPVRAVLKPYALPAFGALGGLAWGCGLRGFMTQVTTDPSVVTWSGTFAWMLAPSVVTGLLLGWAEHLRRTTADLRWRWLVLSPFVFAVVLVVDVVRHGATLQGGIGGGTVGVPAFGVIGAYAIAGRRHWLRATCGLIAISAVPVWALTATGIGGPSLGLDQPKGLWVALYYWTFLAVLMIACAIPLRIPPKPPGVPDMLEQGDRFQKR